MSNTFECYSVAGGQDDWVIKKPGGGLVFDKCVSKKIAQCVTAMMSNFLLLTDYKGGEDANGIDPAYIAKNILKDIEEVHSR
jgi:hypothetical protein